jgi:hypothetical protein
MNETLALFFEKFGGKFIFSVPGAYNCYYQKDNGRYVRIVPLEDFEEILPKLVEESLRTGKDLLEERYKNNVPEPVEKDIVI